MTASGSYRATYSPNANLVGETIYLVLAVKDSGGVIINAGHVLEVVIQ